MESEYTLRKSLERQEEAHGPQSIEVGRALHQLANVLASRVDLVNDGDGERPGPSPWSGYPGLAEIKALYERAVSIKQGALGPDDPEIAAALHDWALLCDRVGEHQQARSLWRAAEEALGRPE
jgi:hypothetical protein